MTRALVWVGVVLMCAVPVAAQTTYYVDNTAADCATYNPATRSCTGGSATSRDTIAEGLALLSGGDTLLIRAGTFGVTINGNVVPSGATASWDDATVVAGYPGETVTLNPTGVAGVIIGNWASTPKNYIIFQNLVLDGVNTGGDTTKDYNGFGTIGTSHHIRLLDVEIKNMWHQGALTGVDSSFIEFVDCHVHNNGTDPDYYSFSSGIYMASDFSLIDNCDIHDNAANGIQVFDQNKFNIDSPVVRNNRVYDNGHLGPTKRQGVVVSHGDNALVYNNVIYGNATTGLYVHLGTITNAKLYNNTVYGNGIGLTLFTSSTDAIVRNNLFVGNTQNVQDSSNNTTWSNNICSTTLSGICASVASASSLFVDAANDDFHLISSASAIDAGASLVGVVDTDFDGVARPQNGVWDVGAYEFVTGGGGGPGDTVVETFDVVGSDTFEWPAGVTQATVEVIGAGGGGKGGGDDPGGGGGGGGALARGVVLRPGGENPTSDLMVGAGGVGGTAGGGNGSNGGESFFGSATTIRAGGGPGATGITGASAGSATHGTDLFPGGAGGNGVSHQSQPRGGGGGGSSAGIAASGVNGGNAGGSTGGSGGTAPLGGGNGAMGGSSSPGITPGAAGTQPGGGGGGGSNQQAGSSTNTGGAGADGRVIVTYVLPIPTGPSNAPSNLLCSAVSFKQINCGWDDNSDDEDGFEIERCSGSGCSTYALIRTTGSNVLQFSDTNLPQGTTWRYRIRSFNQEGESSYATASEATTLISPRRDRWPGLFR